MWCSFSDTFLPFLSIYRSLLSRRREVDQSQSGAGRDGEKRSLTGTMQAVTATQVGTGAGAPHSYIFSYFCILSTHLFYSFFFFLVASFPQSATIGETGRDTTNICAEREFRSLLMAHKVTPLPQQQPKLTKSRLNPIKFTFCSAGGNRRILNQPPTTLFLLNDPK